MSDPVEVFVPVRVLADDLRPGQLGPDDHDHIRLGPGKAQAGYGRPCLPFRAGLFAGPLRFPGLSSSFP